MVNGNMERLQEIIGPAPSERNIVELAGWVARKQTEVREQLRRKPAVKGVKKEEKKVSARTASLTVGGKVYSKEKVLAALAKLKELEEQG